MALPDISYYLSQGRYLTHICIVGKELNILTTTFEGWRYLQLGWVWFGLELVLDEVESLICNFYFSVAACKIFGADQSVRYTSMLLGR